MKSVLSEIRIIYRDGTFIVVAANDFVIPPDYGTWIVEQSIVVEGQILMIEK